jgi:DNA-binding response OmpR family regulator
MKLSTPGATGSGCLANEPAAGLPIVLVVDDDPTFCTLMTEVLKMYRVRVHSAYSAQEAMAILETMTPDLILTDVMMPEVDGLTLVRRIRSAEPFARVPVIVVSAGVSSREQAEALQAGADRFLPKPFSLRDLDAAVGAVLPN